MSSSTTDSTHPHGGQPLRESGADPDQAPAAVVLLHGRGATAESILSLGEQLDRPELALFAPQAADHTWYPRSFLAPLEDNQPRLDSALTRLAEVVEEVEDRGISADRIVLLGFSQGACLTSEFAARTPRRYGGIICFTGGLIGPDNTPRNYPGSLDSTPVFLGSAQPDPHVPAERVEETASVLEAMGASVTSRLYPGMGHTINPEELDFAREIVDRVLDRDRDGP